MNLENLEQEVLDQIELEALLTENPFWEVRNFDEFGYFVGPKDIADKVETLLEEV